MSGSPSVLGIPIYMEDLLQVVLFSNQFGGMANILSSGLQAFDDA